MRVESAAGRWIRFGHILLFVVPVLWAHGSTPSWAQARRVAAKDFGIPQVRLINEQLQQAWSQQGVRPVDMASDEEWCRRLFLDVLGRIPTVDELRLFRASRDANKRRRLVDQLLDDERYRDEYTRNWTTVWTNLLIGRSGGAQRNSLTSRAGMQQYLRESFAADKPYDRLAYELVTATGTTEPGTEDFNGATNFLVEKVSQDNAVQAAAMTSKIFLGTQVQCTQCHNHPFNDWKQRKFWEMNAFFRQTAVSREGRGGAEATVARLFDRDFPGEGNTPEEAEIYYELRNGEMEVAYPVFLNGTAIARSGRVQDVVRREELASLIVESELLEQTLVNRMWAHFLGYGFTKPVDDLGPHNPPSHPQLLEALATEFRLASFDMRALVRWITLSQPYGLSSRPRNASGVSDDPTLGDPPRFSRFYLRQMQAEQLYESLLVATQADRARTDETAREEAKDRWLRQFVIAFGNDEAGETTLFNGTIPQALMLFNGEFIREAIALEPGTLLRGVVDSDRKPADKIHYLFEAGLARPARAEELVAANQLLVARQGNMAEAMQDLWWAILNSNEFILNH